jgi:2-methylcitrate dehydratase PrpD
MRGVEQPGMTKDGIGWGSYAGVAAAQLAERGFTGSGTVFDEPDVTVTDSLNDRFHVTEGYMKPYPCCRWAQPGVRAVLGLRECRAIVTDLVEDGWQFVYFTAEDADRERLTNRSNAGVHTLSSLD